MKKPTTVGIALVILGIMMFVYTGINFITTKEVVDLGPLKINKEENHPIQWSPVVGVVLVLSGIVIVLRNRKGSD